ncbi:hypothetical protein ACJX0J_020101, partial [Zea mays]
IEDLRDPVEGAVGWESSDQFVVEDALNSTMYFRAQDMPSNAGADGALLGSLHISTGGSDTDMFSYQANMKNVEMAHALSLLAQSDEQVLCRAKRINSDEDIMSKAHEFSFITYNPKTIISNMKNIGINLGKNEKEIDRLANTGRRNNGIDLCYDLNDIFWEGMLLGTRETFTRVNGILNFQIWLIRDDFHDMVSSIWDQETKGYTAIEKWQNKIRAEIRLFQRAKIYSLEDDSGTSIVDEEDYYKGLFGKPEFTSIELEESITNDITQDFHNNSLPV